MIAWLGSSIGFAFHNSSFFPMEIDSAPQLCNRVDTVLEFPLARGMENLTSRGPTVHGMKKFPYLKLGSFGNPIFTIQDLHMFLLHKQESDRVLFL